VIRDLKQNKNFLCFRKKNCAKNLEETNNIDSVSARDNIFKNSDHDKYIDIEINNMDSRVVNSVMPTTARTFYPSQNLNMDKSVLADV
jgi:hypothetical protein